MNLDKENCHKLLDVLKSYASTERDKALCGVMVQTMQFEEATHKDIAIVLSTAISDGLRYGNWPWNIIPKTKRT